MRFKSSILDGHRSNVERRRGEQQSRISIAEIGFFATRDLCCKTRRSCVGPSPAVHSSVLTHNFSSAQRTMVLEKGNRFMAPKIVRARNGSSLKAPRWVNSKSGEGQATTR